MTEEESRIFEEKVAEHERQIAERGYAERNGERFYEIDTIYGKVRYTVVPATQERIFRNMAILHLMMSSGVKIDPTRISQLSRYRPFFKKLDEWVEEFCAPEDIEYIEKVTEKAVKYFTNNLREMFAVNMQNYNDETFFYALIKTVGEENSNPPSTESVIFSDFTKFINSSLKNRLNIRKASGKKSKRTGEELQEMLSFYDSILPMIQKAKKDYTSAKAKPGWVKTVHNLNPHLPVHIVEMFDQRGVAPNNLALIMVAEKFDAEPTEALRKKLLEIRKAKKEK